MRILGVSRKWDKLKEPDWTTFRFIRRDKDWKVGEIVQVVYKPRSKQRQILGVAEIISRELRHFFPRQGYYRSSLVSEKEAIEDGFKDRADMMRWLGKAHGERIYYELMNKLTLRWVTNEPNV